MVFGLTSDFLFFLGSVIALLLLCPITLLFGYVLSQYMEWIVEHVLQLMGRG